MKNNLLACLLLLATSTANAALINIDFGPIVTASEYDGRGIFGNSSDITWNSVNTGTASNLTFANGTPGSGVNITTTFSSSASNIGADSNPRTNTLLADRVYGTAASGSAAETITLSNLTPSSAYDIVFYNGFYAQEYSIGGLSATTNPVDFSADNNYPWTDGEGVEYAMLASAMSNGSGNLVITVTPFDGVNSFGLNSAIAGLQIQESVVPLPAAAYLFVTGLLGLAGIARRKKT